MLWLSVPKLQSTSNISTTDLEDKPTQSIYYKYWYDELLKELLLFKEVDVTYKSINENLWSQIKDLQTNLNAAKFTIEKNRKANNVSFPKLNTNNWNLGQRISVISVHLKSLGLNHEKRNRSIGPEKRYKKHSLSDILVSVHKHSNVYIKDDLKYPLPGK